MRRRCAPAEPRHPAAAYVLLPLVNVSRSASPNALRNAEENFEPMLSLTMVALPATTRKLGWHFVGLLPYGKLLGRRVVVLFISFGKLLG